MIALINLPLLCLSATLFFGQDARDGSISIGAAALNRLFLSHLPAQHLVVQTKYNKISWTDKFDAYRFRFKSLLFHPSPSPYSYHNCICACVDIKRREG